MLKKIRQIPMGLAIVVMIVCVSGGVALGNRNALSRAVEQTKASLSDAAGLAYQRVDMAEHRLLVLCARNIPDHAATKALESAIEVSRRAKTPGEIARADKALSSAAESVLEPLGAVASAKDKELTTGVMDDMISAGKILLRSADAYNKALEDVRKVYNALPARLFLGGMPEAFK